MQNQGIMENNLRNSLLLNASKEIDHLQNKVVRKPYVPPVLTPLGSEEIEGGQTSHVLEISGGLLTLS